MTDDAPRQFRCAECGAALGGHHWRVCSGCSRLFCRRHLFIDSGEALCPACRRDRENRDVPARR